MAAVMSCAGCGAPLVDPGQGERITCAYCRREHTVHRSAPTRGRRIYAPGQPVLVHWGSTWWDAHVQEVVGERAFRIRYDGYSSRWDEVVGPARIRPRSEEDADPSYDASWEAGGTAPPAPTPARQLVAPSWSCGQVMLVVFVLGGLLLAVGMAAYVGLSRPGRGPIALDDASSPPGVPVPPGTVLAPGQDVRVLWTDSWYDGTVLQPLPDGRILIRYDGWGSRWDEPVTPDRVRLP
jgi:hypothetical protein